MWIGIIEDSIESCIQLDPNTPNYDAYIGEIPVLPSNIQEKVDYLSIQNCPVCKNSGSLFLQVPLETLIEKQFLTHKKIFLYLCTLKCKKIFVKILVYRTTNLIVKEEEENNHKNVSDQEDDSSVDLNDLLNTIMQEQKKENIINKQKTENICFQGFRVVIFEDKISKKLKKKDKNVDILLQEYLEKDKELSLFMNGDKSMINSSSSDVQEKYERSTAEEKIRKNFKKAISSYPNQVIRFCTKQEEIISFSKIENKFYNTLTKKLTKRCHVCSEKYSIQLQILPQIINFLIKLNENIFADLDFSALVILTCSNYCIQTNEDFSISQGEVIFIPAD
eukprot:snap_masked-scaffold_24-processed-gene-2.46-mRNA-1 protein AED:1.00 eAED:1.00 QI:0/0/0/0/1/1/2/0/334